MKLSTESHRRRERGATLIEFAFVAVVLVTLLFGVIEIERMIIVYNTMAHAADAGVRYAIVHGSKRTGTGVDGPSGPGANPTQVVNVVQTYAGMGVLDVSRLSISVTYPSTRNDPGEVVMVTVSYPYDPLTRYFPLSVTLSSRTQSVITF
jgi:Flp pilus assembly protein TadG